MNGYILCYQVRMFHDALVLSTPESAKTTKNQCQFLSVEFNMFLSYKCIVLYTDNYSRMNVGRIAAFSWFIDLWISLHLGMSRNMYCRIDIPLPKVVAPNFERSFLPKWPSVWNSSLCMAILMPFTQTGVCLLAVILSIFMYESRNYEKSESHK